jgi:hypothetical protein
MRLAETNTPIIPDESLPVLQQLQLSDETKKNVAELAENLTPFLQYHVSILLKNAPKAVVLPNIPFASVSNLRNGFEKAKADICLYKIRNVPDLYVLANTLEEGSLVLLTGEKYEDETVAFTRKNLALLLKIARVKDSVLIPILTPFAAKIIYFIAQTNRVLISIRDFQQMIFPDIMMGRKQLWKIYDALKVIKKTISEEFGVDVQFQRKDECIQIVFENDIEKGSRIVPHEVVNEFQGVPDVVLDVLFGFNYSERTNNFNYQEKAILSDLLKAQLDGSKIVKSENYSISPDIMNKRKELKKLSQSTDYSLEIRTLPEVGYILLIEHDGEPLEPFTLPS